MYSVGLDEEGNTILKVGTDFTTTLTMNQHAVMQLIRLLEATLPEYKEDDEQFNRNGYNYSNGVEMANVKQGNKTRSPQWWKHLRDWKRVFWKSERQAQKKDVKNDRD